MNNDLIKTSIKTKIKKIKKRDGRIVKFNPDKIATAIWKAAKAVGGKDKEKPKELAEQVVRLLEKKLKPRQVPTVEQVQDLVEKVLVENGHYKTAKAYILYRQKRAEARKACAILGVKDDLKLPLNTIVILAARYLLRDEERNIIETTNQLFRRVAKTIAEVEKKYRKSNKKIKELEEKFYQMMINFEFLPNSPTLMNAGTKKGLTLSACFVIPIEDDMESIFEAVKTMALVQKAGGGTGFSFSKLRPAGDVVKSTGGTASGPISFMKVFDAATEQIKQGGKRRGANMGILRVDHPDILDFIVCKEVEGVLRNFNISVGVTDKFMRAVENDGYIDLINPRNGKSVKRIKARAIWNLIATMAWKNGEPGIIFLDTINKHNPTPHIGTIEATNPCVTGDTFISTEHGLLRMRDLVAKYPNGGIKIAVDNRVPIEIKYPDGRVLLMKLGEMGVRLFEISKAFCTGVKDVYKIETQSGYELKATADHKVLTTQGWVQVKDLIPGKHEILIQSGEGKFGSNYELPFKVRNEFKGKNGRIYRFNFPKKWNKELGQVLGWLVGDGWLREGKNCRVGFVFSEDEKDLLNYFKGILNKWYKKEIKEVKRKNGVYHLSYHSKYFVEFFKNLGAKSVKAEEKCIPESIFTAPKEIIIGFLQGLFSADGTVRNSIKSSSDWVALSSKSLKLLKEVQILLLNLGIKSRIFNRSRKPQVKFSYSTKGGKKKRYICDGVLYELGIFGKNLDKFAELINFISKKKIEKLKNIRKKKRKKVKFYDKVVKVEYVGKEKVYDLTQPTNHSMCCNCLVVHQCGEQPLLPYESCNLGSINLSKFVEDGKIDWERLKETVRLAVRFLDNVIDANVYPIKEIDEMTKANRKIGLGVMGFADMLIKLQIPYNSEEALKTAEKVMRFITTEARKMSEELGKEKGNFPNFKGSVWDKRGYKYMRNATVTTIAPTGTISEIAGCSQGIEPLFAIAYMRNVKESLGYDLTVINPLFENISIMEGFYSEELIKRIASGFSIQHIKEIPEKWRKIFVTAMDIDPEWHVRMQAAFQKYTDNSVSKTVNLPNHATPNDVEKIFMLAWKLGCKGITVYRFGSRKVQVINPATGPVRCEACEW